MSGFLILLLAASLAASLVCTAAMMPLSQRLGLVANPGGRHIHGRPTPKGGGIAIFMATWIPVLTGTFLCVYLYEHGLRFPILEDVNAYAQGVSTMAPKVITLFIGGAAIWLLGLADDKWNISPWLRLGAETLVALFLFHQGVQVSLFAESTAVRCAVTVLWIVGLINAFNMLDNMDGLSAGVGLIIASFIGIVAFQTGHYFIVAFLCCLVGAIGGFLVFNFPPAHIFMGDSGSTTIGYMLSVLTAELTFFTPDRPYFPLIMPLLMFGLPIFDTLTVVWIRVRSGRSPFQGDTNHFSHRLVALGMTRRQAVLTIYLVTATVALGATVLYYATSMAILVIFAQTIAVFTIIGILESARPARTQEQPAQNPPQEK